MKIIILALLLIFSTISQTICQIDTYYLTGAKENRLDTLAMQTSEKILKESLGILEKELDPKLYILGPNDILTVAILSTKSKIFDLTVSPEGKLFIPDAGTVDLKGKSLEDAKIIIYDKIKKNIKVDDVLIGLKELRKFKLTVSGAVQKTAIVTATAVDRVSEVIDRAGGLKHDASVRRILLYREGNPNLIKVDLLKYFNTGEKNANPTVLGGDHIIIPPRAESEVLAIYGEIPSPGEYEYTSDDSLSTLIRFAKGFFLSSMLDSVELIRFNRKGQGFNTFYLDLNHWRDSIHLPVKLSGDLPLEAGDRIIVKKKSDWVKQKYATITGEVLYPGKYPIDEKTIRVKDIIEKAGFVKPQANIDASILIRQSEKYAEDKEMDRLRRIPYNEMSKNEARYFQSKVAEIKGIMAIDFRKIINSKDAPDNIILMNEDSIHIPFNKLFINVQGRVNNPGLVNYDERLTYLDYIELAGGVGFRANLDATLIVKSKGQQFLAKNMDYKIEPGDNILIPPESETTFFEVFTTALTIATQLVTIAGVVLAIMRF